MLAPPSPLRAGRAAAAAAAAAASNSASSGGSGGTAVAPARPRAPAYLTAQDLAIVRQGLQARMAYADSPLLHGARGNGSGSAAADGGLEPRLGGAGAAAAGADWRTSSGGGGLAQPARRPHVVLHHLSEGWRPLPHHLSPEALWRRMREECMCDADAEPLLASFLYSSVLAHRTFEQALAFVLANKLASPTLFSTQLKQLAEDAYARDPSIIEAAMADLHAVLDRDPACDRFSQALLHFKGYQAVQSHRVAHHLWATGRRALALMLQSRVSEAFHVDVHPAASLGRGILLDHATGVVIGETAVVGDNVSMLHHVTLGGSGVGKGVRRHPQIGHGALLGAGVTVLGPVEVGAGAKVGAGSVVVTSLEPHSVAVGVPARIVKRATTSEPSEDMDQTGAFLDYVI